MNSTTTQTVVHKITHTSKSGSNRISTKRMVMLALLSALAYSLMLIHLPFKYLGFLELEFSDVPAVIASLVYGPGAGIMVEFLKNLIKAVTATTTGCVGEMANFLTGACFVGPLGLVFHRCHKKWKTAGAFFVANTGFIIAGILVNYFITVPLYATLFGGMEAVIGVASATVPAVKDLATVVILGITPFNVFKGIVVSVTGYMVYKAVRNVLQN